jgi:hypothetical protein
MGCDREAFVDPCVCAAVPGPAVARLRSAGWDHVALGFRM